MSAAQDRMGLLELPWDGTRRRRRGGRAGAVEMWVAQGERRLSGSGRHRTHRLDVRGARAKC